MDEIYQKAAEAEESLVPRKSKAVYAKEFEKFFTWVQQKKVEAVTEQVLLAYFLDQAKIYKASSLWCTFSKLKCMLRLKNNVDIAKFPKLIAFLKSRSIGYAPEKSEVFSKEQLIEFLTNAPNGMYLLMKVVAIFGLFGVCRRVEFYNLCVDDIKEEGSVLVVHIKDTKTHRPRTFTILNETGGVDYIALIKHNNKCTCNPVGINTFGVIPRKIASYLKLPNADQFTGHSFRRTSATILANGGADIRTLKRHGDWKSDAVVEGYVADSIENKKKIARTLGSSVEITQALGLSPRATCIASTSESTIKTSTSGLTITGNTNCTFYINTH